MLVQNRDSSDPTKKKRFHTQLTKVKREIAILCKDCEFKGIDSHSRSIVTVTLFNISI